MQVRVYTLNAGTVVVFNPLGWSRNDIIRVSIPVDGEPQATGVAMVEKGPTVDIRVLNFDKQTHLAEVEIPVSSVPAMGYQTLHIAMAPSGSSVINIPKRGALAAREFF